MAKGQGSLGASKEFHHARSIMPLSREDTVWLYLSDAFFRNITGPKYRIEMARRLQAVADIELVQLAKLDAAAEGRPGDTIDEIKAGGFLPPEFGPLPDGSHIVLGGGEVYDSVRGHRGAFVPVSDVPIERVTRAEVSEYNKFADYYRAQWGRMDPVTAGVKRTALADNREHIVADVLMSPFARQHFDLVRQRLGPADGLRLAPVPGDMAAIDVVLTDQRIFAGLRDVGPPTTGGAAGPFPLGRVRDFLVGYIGTTGELGVLRHPQHGHSAGVRRGGLRHVAAGRVAAAVGQPRWGRHSCLPFHRVLLPTRRARYGRAAIALRAGRSGRRRFACAWTTFPTPGSRRP